MFFRVLPLIAVVACVPPEGDGRDEDVDWLLDGASEFRERARVLADTQGKLVDGTWLQRTELPQSQRQEIVAELGPDSVTVLHQSKIDLLIEIDHQDLARTVPEPTWTHGDRGVRVPAGATLEFGDSDGDAVYISGGDDLVIVSTDLREEELAVYWLHDGELDRRTRILSGDHRVDAETVLYDAPAGLPIATLLAFPEDASQPEYMVASKVESVEGWVRIQAGDMWQVDGWVREEAVQEGHGGVGLGMWSSTRCGFGMNWQRHTTVAAGTAMYGETGQRVGRVTSDLSVRLQEEEGDWASFEHWTSYGTARLWVAPEDRVDPIDAIPEG